MNESIPGTGQPEAPPLVETPSPGMMLARRRAERSLSLGDVAQRLKFGARQIEALEQDDYSRLPGPTFVRGMLRGYAKLLEMDPGPLLKELERREIPAQVTVDLRAKRIPFPDGTRRSTRVYFALSGLVVAIAVAVVYEWQIGHFPWNAPEAAPLAAPAALPPLSSTPEGARSEPPRADVPPEVPSPAKPEVSKPVAGAAPPAAAIPTVAAVVRIPSAEPAAYKGRLLLKFQRESWVEIKQADGRLLMSQTNRGGTEQEIGGTPPFDVVIGNAPSVRLIYNGQTVDLRPHFKVDVARLILE